MKLLDLFCGAGGAAVGYHRVGFEVVGVDIKEQPNYPFEFIQSDVFSLDQEFLEEFDVIHASPPCQAYSYSTAKHRNLGKQYSDLLGKTRELLVKTDKRYIIENVVGAQLIRPLKLCGTMFNLRVIRHRLFEINSDAWVYPPCNCQHNGHVYTGEYVCVVDGATTWTNWRLSSEEKESSKQRYQEHLKRYVTVAGHGGNGSARYLDWCDAMGIHWMNKHPTLAKNKYDLTQAIPPKYCEWIGRFLGEEICKN